MMKNRKKFILTGLLTSFIIGEVFLRRHYQTTAKGKYKYAVIFGAKVEDGILSKSLRYRLNAAIRYGKKYPNTIFIVSGGQGSESRLTEAEAMTRYLIKHGIANHRIIKEETARNTYENIHQSIALMEDDILGFTIISSRYHIERIKLLAKRSGYQTDYVIAKTPKGSQLKMEIRERLALIKALLDK